MKSPFAVLLVLVAACAAPPVTPPVPQPPVELAPSPPELSTIIVPIRYDLGSIAKDVEARVPRTFADTLKTSGVNVRYDVNRDPLKLAMIGAGLHTTTTVHYALEVCKLVCVSCGFKERRSEADVTLHTKLEWDPAWRIKSKTTLLPVDYPVRCTLTRLELDATRFVKPHIEEQLTIAASTIDANTAKLANVKPQAQQIWTSLQTPSELAPRTWLVLEPVDLALGPIGGSGSTITSTLSLQARTRVVVGEKPAIAIKPLPALKVANPSGNGLRVPFDLELPYGEATRLANLEFAGKTVQGVKVNTLTISRAANDKLQIDADIVSKKYKGIVRLEGTPQFDGTKLTLPDLDYSLETKRRSPFFRLAERAAHEGLRQRLRDQARFDLTKRLDEVRAEITRALNRSLANGVALRGRADAMQPRSVTPKEGGIFVRMVATGVAEVSIR